MRNVSDKSCRENQNTHISKNRTVCELMWKKGRAGQATDDKLIRRMSFTCWTTKATDTHTEYVTLITFPLQQ
jgi:hypothetical protein